MNNVRAGQINKNAPLERVTASSQGFYVKQVTTCIRATEEIKILFGGSGTDPLNGGAGVSDECDAGSDPSVTTTRCEI